MGSVLVPAQKKALFSKPNFTFVTRSLNLDLNLATTVTVPNTELFTRLSNYLSRFRFKTLHWMAFIAWSLISSLLIWVIQRRHGAMGYLTCLFFAVSSITDTGLSPANVSALNTVQQALLCVNFILGSAPITGLFVLTVRKRSMEESYGEIINNRRRIEEHILQEALLILQTPGDPAGEGQSKGTDQESSESSTHDEAILTSPLSTSALRKATLASNVMFYWRGFLSRATVGRNSTFFGLSREERESIACVEYRSLKLLRRVVALYVLLSQLLGAISLALYFQINKADVIGLDGMHPISLGVFNSISAFNNAGMSLMNNSMMPFRTGAFPVLLMSHLMLAGNTGFPIFLRITLWVILKMLPRQPCYDRTRATLVYILMYPRRVYTHLFPSRETLYLFIGLMVLNGIDWVAFEISARHLAEVRDLPLGSRILVGLFQSLSVRCSGFNIVTVSALPCGLLVLYIGMMYISAFPVTITMRSSNVYEERSLGVYSASQPFQADETCPKIARTGYRDRMFFLTQQIRSQLSYDSGSIMLMLIIAAFREGGESPTDVFPIFPVIFEVFSAYANIGLSMGLSDQSYSLCGSWHWSSNFCLMIAMLLGRARSTANSVDRAVQLPDKELGLREEADEREREHELAREIEMEDGRKME